ncbi:hypothetical protein D3C87_1981320 [compost metagenome]
MVDLLLRQFREESGVRQAVVQPLHGLALVRFFGFGIILQLMPDRQDVVPVMDSLPGKEVANPLHILHKL